MEIVKLIVDNWYIILGIVAILVVLGFSIYKFAGLPTKEQITKIKEWLLYAVIEAEKELGDGTGVAKLRKVYDVFITKFPVASAVMSFEAFSKLVDSALDEMKEILEKDTKGGIANYISN